MVAPSVLKSLGHCVAVLQTSLHYHYYHKLTSFIAFLFFQDKGAQLRLEQRRIQGKGENMSGKNSLKRAKSGKGSLILS